MFDGILGQFLGLLGTINDFSYKNILFYVGSGLTVYSHSLFKNIKIKAQKLVFCLIGLISIFSPIRSGLGSIPTS